MNNKYISKYFFDNILNVKNNKVKLIVANAVIAAIYVVITYAIAPIGYGTIQFRISELLNWTTWMNPAAIPGLVIGCFIANLNSPFGFIDVIFGTFATFLTCFLMSRTKNIYIASIWASIFSILIGVELLITGMPFPVAAIETSYIMISELIIMAIIGIPIVILLERKFIKNE